ncbi:MAG: SMC-Scp complex subunit ScpB [Bacteroidetes bacterium]|nr:SMC-Scp complex subunit ScpB [Bacteroidota bacterium]
MNLKSIIEALLFVSDRPLTKIELTKLANTKKEEIEQALNELKEDCEKNNRGIILIERDDKVQFATSPSVSDSVKKFLDFEIKEDLTPAALETLSIISYRGPILKEELDNIRGVNCSVILRHLMVKGLVDEKKENEKSFYSISFDFLHWLGCAKETDLPSYEKFHNLEINLPATDLSNQKNNVTTDKNDFIGNAANQ